MGNRAYARTLFRLAEQNITALRNMLDPEAFSDEIYGFQAQQSVEKILKGWLTANDISYPKTHDIEHLIRRLTEHGIAVPDCFYKLISLNDFAVQFRYDLFDDEPIDRNAMLAYVEQCWSHIPSLSRGARSSEPDSPTS